MCTWASPSHSWALSSSRFHLYFLMYFSSNTHVKSLAFLAVFKSCPISRVLAKLLLKWSAIKSPEFLGVWIYSHLLFESWLCSPQFDSACVLVNMYWLGHTLHHVDGTSIFILVPSTWKSSIPGTLQRRCCHSDTSVFWHDCFKSLAPRNCSSFTKQSQYPLLVNEILPF